MLMTFLTKDGFDIREQPIPVCNDNEVLIKTLACGICEGDVFQYKSHSGLSQPIPLGHEGSGVIQKVGKAVKGFSIGDKVTSLCGAYGEYFKCSSEGITKIPDNLEPSYALGEPISCFVHASQRCGIKNGNRVVIIGCGYMGMGCVQMACFWGAGEIYAIEPIKWRRDVALEHGATQGYDPAGKTTTEILDEIGEFEIVIEATGVAPVVDLCTVLVKQHGKIILVGYHQSNNGMRNVDMKTWNYKAIDVINGHVRRDDEKSLAMKQGIKLLSEGKLDFKGMIQMYSLQDIKKAFENLINRKPGLYKAVIVF